MNSYFSRRRLLFVCLHRACVHAAAAADECTAINPSKADAANERYSLYDLPLLRARRFKAITVSAQLQALITAPVQCRSSAGVANTVKSTVASCEQAIRCVHAPPPPPSQHVAAFTQFVFIWATYHIALPLN